MGFQSKLEWLLQSISDACKMIFKGFTATLIFDGVEVFALN
jgi:hypothetical protein